MDLMFDQISKKEKGKLVSCGSKVFTSFTLVLFRLMNCVNVYQDCINLCLFSIHLFSINPYSDAIILSAGLAFDDWDITYYAELFQNKIGRNPTSVECFDLAQSNR
jgi:hypothetical protein